ncbi:MAG: twin-arginine translocase subunit TatC [Synergistaceae bacterium]|jgi:sec-independent protein translocase protein TatC|nr:twin-arginine translocase subunit TatC [Synergistaceae bacterium]
MATKASDEKTNEWEEHLDELRRRIIAALVVFSAATLAAFFFSDRIANFLMSPVSGLGVTLYTFSPSEKFMTYLRLAVWTGLVVSAPFFLLQSGAFIWPALRGNERKYAAATLSVVPALFLVGAGLAYRLLAPVVLGFFLSFGSGDAIQPLWGLREYLTLLSGMMIAAGLLLQSPLLLFLSFILGVTTPKKVARLRPHVILLIFFAAAICTPPDVISQIALGVPLYLLFELTLLFGKFLKKD